MEYSKEIYPGIFQIKLPLPGKNPGPVNVYIFIGEEITLLDTGISRHAIYLKKALKELNLTFSSIDNIVITHGHIDHYGAAKEIVKSSKKVKIYAHIEDAFLIESGFHLLEKRVSTFMRIIGVPFKIRYSFKWMNYFFNLLAKNCKIDVSLKDGDVISLGKYKGKIIHTPGHSMGSICIYLENENILFSGDHIIEHITPNAFIMFEPDSDMPLRLSQVEFFDSLKIIEKIDPEIIFSGHGKKITDLKKTLEMYRKSFENRQKSILEIIKFKEKNVYTIARELFPALSWKRIILEIFLAVSEVYTHLQVLEKDGIVHSKYIKNKLYYYPTR